MKFDRGGQFQNPPAGSHVARCIALIDLGTQHHQGVNGGEAWDSRDVRIMWELPEEKMTGKYNKEVKGKPFAASVSVKQSMHPAAKLRKLLESWRGKKYGKDDIAAFDPKKLLGFPCLLNLVENGDYVNVEGVAPLPKTTKCPKQINPSTFFSLEEDEFDEKVFARLPEKLREKISKSPEFKAIMGEAPQEDAQGEPAGAGGSEPDDNEPF